MTDTNTEDLVREVLSVSERIKVLSSIVGVRQLQSARRAAAGRSLAAELVDLVWLLGECHRRDIKIDTAKVAGSLMPLIKWVMTSITAAFCKHPVLEEPWTYYERRHINQNRAHPQRRDSKGPGGASGHHAKLPFARRGRQEDAQLPPSVRYLISPRRAPTVSRLAA